MAEKDYIGAICRDGRNRARRPLSSYGELLGVRDVAEYLGVSTRSVYRWSDSGELDSVKIGNRLFFRRDELARRLGVELR